MASNVLDVEDTLAKLCPHDKIKLLTGKGFWNTASIPDPNARKSTSSTSTTKTEQPLVPPIRFSDGPNGVRGRFFRGFLSSCFPCSTGLGSSFDRELVAEVGRALGDEARTRGVHVLLGPTVNTQRSPLGGRSFESYSEDPHLNGTIAAEYIKGLQSKGVSACIKHFAANDQEFERFSVSSEVSERALREIYLKPFQIAVRDAKPWALMASYNLINGVHATENKWLLGDILRKEWGWDGLVTSDWTGTFSTTEAIKAGLDLEMPGPTTMRGKAIGRALASHKLRAEDIDARVRNVLGAIKRIQESANDTSAKQSKPCNASRELLRKACADTIVLLKNQPMKVKDQTASKKNLLPLQAGIKTIAVIGPNATDVVISGGGSAALRPTYVVSPFDAIRDAAKKIGAEAVYTIGVNDTRRYFPAIDPYLTPKLVIPSQETANLQVKPMIGRATTGDTDIGLFESWNAAPTDDWMDQEPDFKKKVPMSDYSKSSYTASCFFLDEDEENFPEHCWSRFTTIIVPEKDCELQLDLLCIFATGNLFINNRLIIDLSSDPQLGQEFYGMGTKNVKTSTIAFTKGKEYRIELRMCNKGFVDKAPPVNTRGGLKLGASKKLNPVQDEIKLAAELAKKVDVAVLVVGLNEDWESEGIDRTDLKLPGSTNALVEAVIAANPHTVVVNQSGAPVEMPWIDKLEHGALLQAFYGGNEVGNGIADVLFGEVNPSAKLSLTFPKRLEDNPSYPSYGFRTQNKGRVLYNEGIFVGYRGYEIKNLEPLFPFGFGLSYTTFKYSKLSLSPIRGDRTLTVTFTIENTGKVFGHEVAQVYVSDPVSSLPRPKKELHGFVKVPLKPKERRVVSVNLDKYALSFFDEEAGHWVAEAGDFVITVGGSSDSDKLLLKDTVKLERGFTWVGL